VEKQLEDLENRLTQYFTGIVMHGQIQDMGGHKVIFRPTKNGECRGEVVYEIRDHLSIIHWKIQQGTLLEPHKHDQRETYYILRGKAILYCNKAKITLVPHDTYYCLADILHAYYFPIETEMITIFCPPASTEILSTVENKL
jgi:quercetin dioxygenase-like cupin family protein